MRSNLLARIAQMQLQRSHVWMRHSVDHWPEGSTVNSDFDDRERQLDEDVIFQEDAPAIALNIRLTQLVIPVSESQGNDFIEHIHPAEDSTIWQGVA